MGFLAPWFLAGLAAVGLPIWLHLLKQHKTTPLPFSSLMFFERRTQSSIKHRRLRYLLLFALRTALVALLAFAFARPFVNSAMVASARGGKLVVLAIDHSFSMQQGDRLGRAKSGAEKALSSLRPEDRGLVLALGSQAHLMGEPSNDVSGLRGEIRAIQPSDERGSYAELVRVLRSLAQSANMPVEAHLFSDMQKSSMPPGFADLELGQGIRLLTHIVTDRTLSNFTVENVTAPRRLYDPKKVRIQATVMASGGATGRRRVALLLNGREVASKPVDVSVNGRATAEFVGLDAPYGMNRGEVRIDSGDAFAADDHYYFSVERSDPRAVLFVHAARDGRDLLYYRMAIESARDAAFTLQAASPDQAASLPLARYAFVVLSDAGEISASFEQALRHYAKAGGSVLVALGPSTAARKRVPVSDEPVRETRYAARDASRFETVTTIDSAHPVTRQAGNWTGVKFYRTTRVEPGPDRVLAKLSDDTPLLIERQVGDGRVVTFASTFDNVANDFPLHAGFVPFVDETAHYLAGLDDRPANFNVGAYLDLRTGREPSGAAIEVLDPHGARAMTLAESARAQNIQLTEQGFYEVRRPSHHDQLIAVNPDRRESDFEVISPETLALWQNTGQGSHVVSAATSGMERKPLDFWWYVMILVLALAVAESLVGNKHLTVDKEAA
ncbi:MAG TPA: BatA domain-containing protein [Bryobacteraceae bacterium]|nr:BatA domain-containing protein [Bryobacteraceae bacterium]